MKMLIPIDPYDFAGMEIWLQTMEAKGYRLQKAGYFTATFSQQAPQAAWYFVVPGADQERERIESLGWRLVTGTKKRWFIYRSEAEKEGPRWVNNQEAMQQEVKKALRGIGIRIAEFIFWITVFVLICTLGAPGQLPTLVLNDALMGAIVVLLLFGIMQIRTDVKRYRWLKQYAKEQRDTARRRSVRKILYILFFLLVASEGILWGLGAVQSWEKPVSQTDLSYVTLDKLEGEALDYSEYRKEYGNTAQYKTSWLVPEQLEITLSGQKANDYVPVMQMRQYRVRFEGMGSTLLQAFMAASLSWNSRLIANPISVTGCDEAYSASFNNVQYLFLRKADQLMTVYYVGEQTLVEHAELFEQQLVLEA